MRPAGIEDRRAIRYGRTRIFRLHFSLSLFLSLFLSRSRFRFLAAFIRVAGKGKRCKNRDSRTLRAFREERLDRISDAARRPVLREKWTADKKRDRRCVHAGLRNRIQCISVPRTIAPNDSLHPRVRAHTSPFHRGNLSGLTRSDVSTQ